MRGAASYLQSCLIDRLGLISRFCFARAFVHHAFWVYGRLGLNGGFSITILINFNIGCFVSLISRAAGCFICRAGLVFTWCFVSRVHSRGASSKAQGSGCDGDQCECFHLFSFNISVSPCYIKRREHNRLSPLRGAVR